MYRRNDLVKALMIWCLLLFSGIALSEPAEPISAYLSVDQLITNLNLRESSVDSRNVEGWNTPQKIVTFGLPANYEKLMREVAGDIELVSVSSMAEAKEALADSQVFIGFCNKDMLDAGPGLHWIHSLSAGVERCAEPARERLPAIMVSNAQRLYGPEIAEYVMATMLSLNRQLPFYARERRWVRSDISNPAFFWGLPGRTMLVVGLGGIGTEIAKRAHALGMTVIATRNSSRKGPEYVEYVGLSDELKDLAARADVVVNAAPLTPSTTDLFDRDFFKTMKSTAHFINIGRGGSVVTEDLVAALKAGDIAAAGLDVTDPEPLPESHELWKMPNVIITPHISGNSDKGLDRTWTVAIENLRRYIAGEPLLSRVDLERGY